MPTINDLRQQAATIKNATQVGENTANRVGTTFETIADLLESMGGVVNLSTIDIGSIDTLNTTGDMLVGTPNIYTLTMTRGANTFKVGTLFQFANNGRYDVAQVIVSQYIIDSDGRIDTTSADQEVHIFYRLCKTMNGGSLPTPIGTWTTWTELGGSGGSGVTVDQYPTQNSDNAVSSGGVFERLQDVAPKVDISAIDDIDEYSDMLATKSPYYIVTKTISNNVFRIGTLMEFANQGRYILYQILATDYVLNEDGTLDTTLSQNGDLKLIWRMKQFSSNPPEGVVIGEWSKWSYLSGDSGYQPNNEDIDLNANDQLQFANKAYDASAFSGLGRVYLRKNIVQLNLTDKYFDGFVNDVLVQDVGTSSTPDAILFDTTRKMFVARVGLLYYVDWSSDEDYNPITRDVNWNYNGNFYRWNGEELVQWDKTINQLTQTMVNTANTIYHIQYDYDLNGQTITLPAGCVLEFDGGKLSNGTIDFNGCFIKSPNVPIFSNTMEFANVNVKNTELVATWFGFTPDNTDVTQLDKIIAFGCNVFVPKGEYLLTSTIEKTTGNITNIYGESRATILRSTTCDIFNVRYIRIELLQIKAEGYYGIKVNGSGVKVIDNDIRRCAVGIGNEFAAVNKMENEISNNTIQYCTDSGIKYIGSSPVGGYGYISGLKIHDNYIVKAGTGVDDYTAPGTEGFGYGIYIENIYAATVEKNVCEYCSFCGIYVMYSDYQTTGLFVINNGLEQNKRAQIVLDISTDYSSIRGLEIREIVPAILLPKYLILLTSMPLLKHVVLKELELMDYLHYKTILIKHLALTGTIPLEKT